MGKDKTEKKDKKERKEKKEKKEKIPKVKKDKEGKKDKKKDKSSSKKDKKSKEDVTSLPSVTDIIADKDSNSLKISDYPISAETVTALADRGITSLFPIQVSWLFPVVLSPSARPLFMTDNVLNLILLRYYSDFPNVGRHLHRLLPWQRCCCTRYDWLRQNPRLCSSCHWEAS